MRLVKLRPRCALSGCRELNRARGISLEDLAVEASTTILSCVEELGKAGWVGGNVWKF